MNNKNERLPILPNNFKQPMAIAITGRRRVYVIGLPAANNVLGANWKGQIQ